MRPDTSQAPCNSGTFPCNPPGPSQFYLFQSIGAGYEATLFARPAPRGILPVSSILLPCDWGPSFMAPEVIREESPQHLEAARQIKPANVAMP